MRGFFQKIQYSAVNVFSLPYDFPNNCLFSAFVRIQYIMYVLIFLVSFVYIMVELSS